ncbi:MAG: DHH family phosphoesterase [Candidatus Pacearchaeota archaeon]
MEILEYIKDIAKKFNQIENKKLIAIYCHNDTDGICSAAIIAKVFLSLDKKFFVRILKNLKAEEIENIKKESKNFSAIFFLDFGSNFLNLFDEFETPIFIIDHHYIEGEVKKDNINLINYRLFNDDYQTSASILTYFFVSNLREFDKEKKQQFQKIALLGLIGDNLDKNLSKLSNLFLKESENSFIIKKGLKVFSYTRPLYKALEYSNIYIPGITGKIKNVFNFLEQLKIETKINGKIRSLNDLSNDEISKLITAIATLRIMDNRDIDILGNVYLINIFEKIEDAREIATLINACGSLNKGYIALSFLLGKRKSKEIADEIYIKYRYEIIKGIKYFEKEIKKIKDENFLIVNLKDKVNPELIGTIASMFINSLDFNDFIIIALAYREDCIKVSLRSKTRNVTKILEKIKKKSNLDFEYGGHENAAGALIKFSQEEEFLNVLKKVLAEEFMTIKI